MSIYYVHGFASHAKANEQKLDELRNIFHDDKCVCLNYDSSMKRNEIVECLCSQVDINDDNFFIGTSLGGYFAYQLASINHELSVALFNPCISPSAFLKVGQYENFHTGQSFCLTDETIISYAGFDITGRATDMLAMTVFLSDNDTIIDNEKTRDVLENHARLITIKNCGHRIHSLLPFSNELIQARNHISI